MLDPAEDARDKAGMNRTFLSISEQVAGVLRSELIRGRWGGGIPGRNTLAKELGVNHKTVDAALQQLEAEGLLVNQGQGRKRRVQLPKGAAAPMRLAILAYDRNSLQTPYMIELMHLLEDAGHTPFSAKHTMSEMKRSLNRVRRLVRATEADAWIVCAGSREILEWFAEQPTPTFALFGRRRGLPLPAVGPDQPSALRAITERFVELGHRRIVLLCMGERRHPEPGASERAFLDTLEGHGIRTGSYNLPEWEESPAGLQTALDSLFQVSPPTALILGDSSTMYAPVQQFLNRRGLRVPEDVSLVLTESMTDLAWCHPSVAHVMWDTRLVIRRIVRWAANVSRGKADVQQSLTPARFLEGGTVGPAPN